MIFSTHVVFLHVPKAGGSSTVEYLLDVLPRPVRWSLPAGDGTPAPDGVERFEGVAHEGLAEARLILARWGTALEDVPVLLACVRDPYAIEVSRYAFLRRHVKSFNHGPEQAVALLGDFELFARCTRPHGGRPLEIYYSLDGAVPDNLRIVRLETLADELPAALAAAGVAAPPHPVPHRNRTEHADIRSFYTPVAEQAVYDKYRWVFDAGLYPRLDLDDTSAAAVADDDLDRVAAVVDPARLAGMDDFGRANAWLAAAEIHRHGRRPTAEAEALAHAIAAARRTGAERLLARTATPYARCLGLGGATTVDDGVRRLEELIDLLPAGRASGPSRLALAELHAARGAFGRARASCAEVGTASVELALAASSAAGSIALLADDAATADDLLRAGRPWNASDFGGDRGDALCRLGRDAEAEAVAAAAAATATASDAVAQVRWRRTGARIAARRGDAVEACRLAEESVAIAAAAGLPNVHADALLDLAEVAALAGRHDAARAAAAEARALYERKGNAVSAARAAAASA